MDRRILVVDDDRSLLDLLCAELQARGFTPVPEESAHAGLQALAHQDFDAVLTDISLHGMSGIDLCREMVARREDTPVICMTAHGSLESAVATIRAGAYDFVTKPLDVDELVLVLERALKHRELRDEVKRLTRTVHELRGPDDMVGESPAINEVRDYISRIADTEVTVLVSGASGTGKELVARAIHARSGRSSGPFVAINCAAMPESLLESELFGHMKGAFTDARATRPGLFVKATGGTLFLDEVAEMPLGMQAKLLRALQERKVRPVGGDTETAFDARIVCATNRDLEVEVEERRFREDLYYRVNVVHIQMPSLAERGNDVLLLANAFLRRSQERGPSRVVGIDRAAAERLVTYPWPGNVRELQNCIERAVALARTDHIGLADLPERVATYKPTSIDLDALPTGTALMTMDEVERRYITHVLAALGGRKASAARVLGMDRRTLYRKLERFETGDRQQAAADHSRR